MTRRKTIILGSVAALAMLAGIAYAIATIIVDRPTGAFTVEVTEAADLSVTTYTQGDASPAGETTGPDWCEGDIASGVYCTAKLQNMTDAYDLDASLEIVNVNDPDAIGADTTVTVYSMMNGGEPERTACQSGDPSLFTQQGSGPLDAFNPVALNVPMVAGGGHSTVCIAVQFTGATEGDTGGSFAADATIRFEGTEIVQ